MAFSAEVKSSLLFAHILGGTSLRKLLQSDGFSRNADSKALTALHLAVGFGIEGVAIRLLEDGANKEARDGCGRTALHMAVFHERRRLVEVLLRQNACAVSRDNEGNTPLLKCFQDEPTMEGKEKVKTRMARSLLAAGASIEESDAKQRSPLFLAVYHNCPVWVKFLIKSDADPDAQDEDGTTPLLLCFNFALLESTRALIELLLDAGADPRLGDHEGNTPLLRCFQYENVESTTVLIERLLRAGADPNAANGKGTVPLLACFRYKPESWKELMEPLLTANANPNIKNERGYTPLIQCLRHGNSEAAAAAVALLLEHGAETFTRDVRETPLHVAVSHDLMAVANVKKLVEYDADVNSEGDGGITPLVQAATIGLTDVVTALLAHSRVQPSNMVSAFIGAAMFGHLPVVELFLDRGVNPNVTDGHGCPVLIKAIISGQIRVVDLLLKRGANTEERDHDALHWARNFACDEMALLVNTHKSLQGQPSKTERLDSRLQ